MIIRKYKGSCQSCIGKWIKKDPKNKNAKNLSLLGLQYRYLWNVLLAIGNDHKLFNNAVHPV